MSAVTVVKTDDPQYFLRTSGNRPFGIAFDNKGLLYMVTAPATGSGTLSKVTPDGEITELVTLEGSFIGRGICINNDNLYASTIDNVIKIDTNGTVQILSPKPLKTSIGIASGGKGFDEKSLYVTVIDGIILLPIK